jgi:hypothetical protein
MTRLGSSAFWGNSGPDQRHYVSLLTFPQISANGKGWTRATLRAVKDAHDHQGVRKRHVVNCVGGMECYAQAARADPGRDRKAGRFGAARRAPRWKRQIASRQPPTLRSPGRPRFGEIMLCRFRLTEGERPANSFLPRSMMRVASKSCTRPSARSVRPRSISAFNAASSWS